MDKLERANASLPESLEKSAAELEAFYNGLGFGIPVVEKLKKLHLTALEPAKRSQAGFRPRFGMLETPIDTSLRSRHAQRHEIGHASSRVSSPHSKLFIDKNTDDLRERAVAKVGLETSYLVRKPWDKQRPIKFFTALNEALNDEIALRAGEPHQSALSNIFLRYLYHRIQERFLFAHIIRNLAFAEERNGLEVFKDFVEAHSIGWTPKLKQGLLSAFGPLALKVLAFVDANGTEGEASLNDFSFGTDVMRFFDLKRVSEQKRAEAGNRILIVAKRTFEEKLPPKIRRVPE